MEKNTPPLTKDEIVAMLRANRELGPVYDEHTAEQILERIQAPAARTDQGTDWRSLREERRAARREHRGRGSSSSIIPGLALSIPLLALAKGVDHGVGIFAVLALDAIMVLASMFRR